MRSLSIFGTIRDEETLLLYLMFDWFISLAFNSFKSLFNLLSCEWNLPWKSSEWQIIVFIVSVFSLSVSSAVWRTVLIMSENFKAWFVSLFIVSNFLADSVIIPLWKFFMWVYKLEYRDLVSMVSIEIFIIKTNYLSTFFFKLNKK